MAVSVETEPTFRQGPPQRLFDTAGYGTPTTIGTYRRMAISPDGMRFLLFKEATAVDDRGPEIILIRNWTDELQRLVPTP